MIRAISRRTPSKLDSRTADGVSSMITSTPVSFSNARMLRPSLPMIRPFISSLGSSTRRVVLSVEALPASRCIATARMLRARRSASACVSSSICCSRRPAWCLASCSTSASSSCFAWAPIAREPLELAALDALGLFQLLGRVIEVALAVVERLRSALEVGALDGQRLGLAERSLLHPGDLLTACRSSSPVTPGPDRRGRWTPWPRAVLRRDRAATVAIARVDPSLPLPGTGRCRGSAIRRSSRSPRLGREARMTGWIQARDCRARVCCRLSVAG